MWEGKTDTNFQLGELYVAEWRTMRAAQMSGYCMAGGRMETTSLSTLAVCCDDCAISSSRFDSSMWHASSFSRSLMRCRRLCISLSISASRCELRAISCRVSSAPAVSARFAAVCAVSPAASRARTTARAPPLSSALSACIARRAAVLSIVLPVDGRVGGRGVARRARCRTHTHTGTGVVAAERKVGKACQCSGGKKKKKVGFEKRVWKCRKANP